MGFKSFAKSVIQDILAMILKFQAMRLVTAGMNFMGLGSMLPKGGSLTISGNPVSGFPMAAGGGDIDGPTIVGEKGPELFIPNRGGGTVIPNNKMQQLGGNQTINNFTINAIDTKSFEQRLLESPTAVWAANQYANKSLAVSRGRT
jgi:hypothetical protein